MAVILPPRPPSAPPGRAFRPVLNSSPRGPIGRENCLRPFDSLRHTTYGCVERGSADACGEGRGGTVPQNSLFILDKGKPSARVGRKANGSTRDADRRSQVAG